MKIEEIQKTINVIILKIKDQRQRNDFFGLLTSGIACLEYSYHLIDPMLEEESKYRKLEAEEISNGALGRAETIAKASEHYKNWQKARYMHNTLLDLNMTSKRLANSNDKELKSN